MDKRYTILGHIWRRPNSNPSAVDTPPTRKEVPEDMQSGMQSGCRSDFDLLV